LGTAAPQHNGISLILSCADLRAISLYAPHGDHLASIVLFDASKGPLDDNYLVEPSMAAQAGLSRVGEPLNKRDIQAHQRVRDIPHK
jgi:hypothetical protein